MSTALIELLNKVLALPIEERALIALRLWDSIESFKDPEIERAWIDVAEKRWKDIEKGKVQCIPAIKVMQKAMSSLTR